MPGVPELIVAKFPDLTGIEFVATGGQKTVYSATHLEHGKVALKSFNPGADHTRFEREIAAVVDIGNASIPRIYGHGAMGESNDQLWLIEEWIDGESLRTRLGRDALPDALILSIASDVLSVLSDAERAKIVHRDVKPENIILKGEGRGCCLIDFGIARHLMRTTLTQGPWGLFSYGYSPPEQFRNLRSEIDSRADLFALGVTLYECVEGSNPFILGAASPDEILRRVETIRLPPLSRRIDSANLFSELVAAMTRTKRTHRVRTAAEANLWMQEILAAGPA